ncbi:molybdopterin molybdotransferase MoeA [Edaphobacter dinghuensis]|uniref:Molybdopterin molybdenumtransferase n=1 Tax=Edaphobacter dinghuensis TaxID=1560005 RepID=A0A917HTC3_9BACT|nr:gephyrin-like molybdotransferase Glp [Edaphobacter dinghuensis]GGG88624.1 molybdopterin molybdenumtransferase MoeA [Edaphobacter dinghuensis]
MNHILDFDEALKLVQRHAADLHKLETETEPLLHCLGRVLAEPVTADRDQPPFDRSTRDGFALRAADTGTLKVIGQIRAGERWSGQPLEPGNAIEIMTGAPVPAGADAVAMIEHVELQGDSLRLAEGRPLTSGENIVPRGSEARAGDMVIARGTAIAAAEIALAASCGLSGLFVYRRPRVAIVATGDELVELDETPGDQQIRNSNSYALAALAAEAGAEAVRLPIARDRRDDLEKIILKARSSDLLLLSGGVSMGKYDLVEEVLHTMNAEFFFTGVKMQPGKPVVFGRLPASGGFPAQYFFGLPGNPVSTQVTFHCFVAPMLRVMAGAIASPPRFAQATLAEDVAGKPGLTRVLPSHLTYDRVSPQVRIVAWQGSGDLAANARANCYVVLPADKERFAVGEVITVLLR